jgi:NH3-dependent NAD+ synthetase
LLHRAYEHVGAALAAFAIGWGPSSEVVARSTIELSVSILYILAGDRRRRLIGYFADYQNSVEKHVKHWQALAEKMSPPERDIHLQAVHKRGQENEAAKANG